MRGLTLLCLFALALSACGRTHADVAATVVGTMTSIAVTDTATLTPPPPSATVTPTIGPTQTSTAVSPLVTHRWNQSEPLITLDIYGGDGGCNFIGSLPQRFTLMPDGSLYMLEFIGYTDLLDLKANTLSRGSTCRLLNSVDQAGFFDYDPATYIPNPARWSPWIMGAGHTAISVQAWRSNAVDLYGVDAFIGTQEYYERTGEPCPLCRHEGMFPTILPALRNTYKLLSGYKPEGLRVYVPVRVGVWIAPGMDADKWDAVDWPLQSPSVADLALLPADPNGAPVAILTGTKAVEVEKMFNQKINICGMVVMNGFDIYRVFARPLLPNEYPSKPLPRVSLSCSPSDGVLPMP